MVRTILLIVAGVTVAVACSDGGETQPNLPTATAAPTLSQRDIVGTSVAVTSTAPTATPIPAPDRSAQGIYILDVHSGDVRRVVEGFAIDSTWTQDGRSIWYATSHYPEAQGGGNLQIHSVDVTTGDDALVFDIPGGGFASIAPAAGRVAFVRHVGAIQDAAEGQGSRIDYTVHVIDGDGERALGSGLSPQLNGAGTQVAFESPACATSKRVAIWNYDSGEQFMSSEPIDPFSTRVGDDGRFRFDAPGSGTSFVVEPSSNVVLPESIVGVDPAELVAISPDGRAALGQRSGNMFIRETTKDIELPVPGGDVNASAWSPDSTLVAYVDSDQLRVVSVTDGSVVAGAERRSAFKGLVPRRLAWSPDGAKIAIEVSLLAGQGVCD